MDACLSKMGNDYALLIDRAMLDALGIDPSVPIEWLIENRQLIIFGDNQSREQRFRRALEDTHKKYGKMLKRLAEE